MEGKPHGGRIIKVFATYQDPREVLRRPDLTVVESSHAPLNELEFDYGDRGTYTGEDIEQFMGDLGLNQRGIDTVRALFRFTNRDDLQSCQEAMKIKVDDAWLIDHPLQDIDLIDAAIGDYTPRDTALHLDIFVASSLERLLQIVNYDDPNRLLSIHEGARFRTGRPLTAEGKRREIK